ncbi:uncharacterized protein PRCAT00002150001 [Priceomyces carsonii]|uniref:uncharacterized protein n=1 Tax=Priceomyces carsonii TaxID=28549 RepID=UPI002EDA9017|nr:unnamed protein product [Priceomyces carsonii]
MGYTKADGSPDLSLSSILLYFKTRVSTLFDIPAKKYEVSVWDKVNPIPGLKLMTASDWNYFGLGFFAWTIDSMDFFCVSASASEIAATLGVSITDITWGVTLVLMLRSVGAFIFGLAADYYGRKWPYIFVAFLFLVIEIATGFVRNYQEFLGVRALFGVAMGGMYGIAAATALEDQPEEARSILSGLFLPGYNLGYIFAVVFFRAFENTYKGTEGWRALFWFSSGLPLILIVWRVFFPETNAFLKLKEKRRQEGSTVSKWKQFKTSVSALFKTEWLMFIYLVLLMSGFNFMSHGVMDLYPTMLVQQHDVGPDRKTVIMVVVNIGAIIGGLFFGQLTEFLGRRLTVIICCIWSCAFLYPAFFVNDLNTLTAGFFFLLFATMGAWGVAPLHLLELVNDNQRVFLSGLVYQLGNLASSASSTIESQLADLFPITVNGVETYDYGRVMGIFSGAAYAYLAVVIFLGPERFHKDVNLNVGRSDDIEWDVECEKWSIEQKEVAEKSV